MKRTPMKHGAPLKRTAWMRRQSPKAAARAVKRRSFVRAVLADRSSCEAPRAFVEGCGFTCSGPLDVHEVLTRARGGDPLDVANVRVLCRLHHDAVHTLPELAHACGLLLSAWEGRLAAPSEGAP